MEWLPTHLIFLCRLEMKGSGDGTQRRNVAVVSARKGKQQNASTHIPESTGTPCLGTGRTHDGERAQAAMKEVVQETI